MNGGDNGVGKNGVVDGVTAISMLMPIHTICGIGSIPMSCPVEGKGGEGQYICAARTVRCQGLARSLPPLFFFSLSVPPATLLFPHPFPEFSLR